jgi:hypothetical protein
MLGNRTICDSHLTQAPAGALDRTDELAVGYEISRIFQLHAELRRVEYLYAELIAAGPAEPAHMAPEISRYSPAPHQIEHVEQSVAALLNYGVVEDRFRVKAKHPGQSLSLARCQFPPVCNSPSHKENINHKDTKDTKKI